MKSNKRCHLQDEKVSTFPWKSFSFAKDFISHCTWLPVYTTGWDVYLSSLCSLAAIFQSLQRGHGVKTAEIDLSLCLSLCSQLCSVDSARNWCLVRQAGSQVLLSHVGNRDRHFSSNTLWAGDCQDHQHFSADTQSRPSISHPLKALQHVEVCDDAERHRVPRQVQGRATLLQKPGIFKQIASYQFT